MDSAGRQVYSLNQTGRVVWQGMEKSTVSEIADVLCQRFEVDRASAVDDVNELITDLLRAGLIRTEESL